VAIAVAGNSPSQAGNNDPADFSLSRIARFRVQLPDDEWDGTVSLDKL